MGVRLLRTPVQPPKANSVCESFGGTLRRECLDFLIPFNGRHLKFLLPRRDRPGEFGQAEQW